MFVSHSGSTIVELCDRALLIDSGEKLAIGIPKKIVGGYQKLLYAPADTSKAVREQINRMDEGMSRAEKSVDDATQEHSRPIEQSQEVQETFDENLKPSSTIVYESHGAYIESPSVVTLSGEQVNSLVTGNNYRFIYTVRFTKSANNVHFGMLIKTTSGVELGGGVSASSSREALPHVEAGSIYRIGFRFRCALNSGVYFLNAGVVGDIDGNQTFLHRLIDIAMFKVQADTENLGTGIVNFSCLPGIELQQDSIEQPINYGHDIEKIDRRLGDAS